MNVTCGSFAYNLFMLMQIFFPEMCALIHVYLCIIYDTVIDSLKFTAELNFKITYSIGKLQSNYMGKKRYTQIQVRVCLLLISKIKKFHYMKNLVIHIIGLFTKIIQRLRSKVKFFFKN